jgi:DNA-binding response OmpR family regulator
MSPRLLVIDPDPGTRQILREFFASAGFQSDEMPLLDGVLVGLAGALPAAVVLHDGIGGPQGVEILQSLRAHHPELPVLFIAHGGDQARAAAARLAATACVSKPFRMDDLLAAVMRAVHGTGPRRRPRGIRRRSGRGSTNGRYHPAELPRELTA